MAFIFYWSCWHINCRYFGNDLVQPLHYVVKPEM